MLETLTDIPLFLDLTPTQLSRLDPLFETYSCPARTIIFEQGEHPQYLYVLIQGTVAIRYKPYDGQTITITHLQKGDAFGWSAVIGSRVYTSGSISKTRVEAIRIRGDDLRTLLRTDPDTGRIILNRLADFVSSRWKNAHAEVQALFDKGLEGSKRNGDE